MASTPSKVVNSARRRRYDLPNPSTLKGNMSKLDKLVAQRRKVRKKRARQFRKFKKTNKQGHLVAFRKLNEKAKMLTAKIQTERNRLDFIHVVSREEWGAAEPHGSYTRQIKLVGCVQHHTAMPTMSAKASRADEEARMRQLQAIHLAEGWTDIAYARVAFPSGRVYEGRPEEYVGAHTLGHNTGYMGWSLDGNYEVDQPTKAAINACHRIRKDLGCENIKLYGHYELTPTACPGQHLKPYLNKEI